MKRLRTICGQHGCQLGGKHVTWGEHEDLIVLLKQISSIFESIVCVGIEQGMSAHSNKKMSTKRR